MDGPCSFLSEATSNKIPILLSYSDDASEKVEKQRCGDPFTLPMKENKSASVCLVISYHHSTLE